jgi:nucleoside-diphosphate-sugar epimerase
MLKFIKVAQKLYMNTNKKLNNKILIIGSDGYIGTLLSDYLLKKKYEVTTLDTGYFRDGLLEKKNSSIINIDIRKFDLSKLKNFKAVVFLAANQNDPGGKISPKKFYNISKKFTLKVASICKKYNVRFIFPSSCSVYGYGNKKFSEQSRTNPLTFYSKNKIEIEKGLSKIVDKSFSPIALRFSTIFGYSSRIRFDLVINMFCLFAIVKKKIYLNSHGLSWRPHLSVEDACEAIYLSLNKKINNGKLNIFNVGHNKNNMQIVKVARLISSITGSKIYFKLDEKKSFIADKNVKKGIDKRSYIVDFSKFKKTFPSFRQKKNLKNEIKTLINKLKKIKVNNKTLNDYRFYRLQKMDFLLKNKKINKDLFWF